MKGVINLSDLVQVNICQILAVKTVQEMLQELQEN